MKNKNPPWFKNWPNDVPKQLNYPEVSLSEILRRAAMKSPNLIAINYSGLMVSFEQLDRSVDKLAVGLQRLGIEKGDRVVVGLPNTPQFVTAFFAVARIGGIIVTCSPLYKEKEITHILQDSGAKIAILWDELYPIIHDSASENALTDVITTNVRDYLQPPGQSRSNTSSRLQSGLHIWDFNEIIEGSNERIKSVKIEPSTDLALLQYTGGTTGTPKGAQLTHYNLVSNVEQVKAWCGFTPNDIHLAALPLFHIFGLTVAMNAPIYTGATMILLPDPRDTDSVLDTIERYQPSVFFGVPTMFIALINRADISKRRLHSLRMCISGGSSLPGHAQRRFETATNVHLVEGYGLTEASPVTHINPLNDRDKNRAGSIGFPLSDTQAKIVDLEHGEHDVPIGEPGELVVRGPQVMRGYWNQPAESRSTIRDDWLYTGDIAVMDSEGYFRIIDRKKDMIDVSGFKVWPREVEEVLFQYPAVREAAVIGISDSRSGEAVKAFVVLKAEWAGKVSAEELSGFCREHLASYKAPKIVEFRSELPKTAVGKVLRRELKD